MDLPIPIQVIYAGLGGSLLALLVATIQQNWKLRVFFLLALRLAIGWHFLFEGMGKIQSSLIGVTGESKPFTSAPYFQEAEGPLGEWMKQTYLDDPEAKLNDFVRATGSPKTLGEFLGDDGKTWLASELTKPGPIANHARLFAAGKEVEAFLALPMNGAGARFLADLPGAKLPEVIEKKLLAALPAKVAEKMDALQTALDTATDEQKKTEAKKALDAARITYARWVVGLDAKELKKKFVSGEVAQTVPARLADYENRKKDLAELRARREVDLGRSTLFAKLNTAKADVTSVRTELIKDADGLLADAKTAVIKAAGVEAPKDPEPAPSKIAAIDIQTKWMLTIAGACLIIGLGTRIAAVVCAGFLVMTYLTHPPFPWYALPPGTEGNPVFINKNAIEAIALMVIAVTPTGSWLGIDGLIARVVFGRKEVAE